MGDADRRDVEHRAELHREPAAARMVPAGRVDEQDVRWRGQLSHHGFERWPDP